MNPLYYVLIGIVIGLFVGSKLFRRKFSNIEEAVRWINERGFNVTLM